MWKIKAEMVAFNCRWEGAGAYWYGYDDWGLIEKNIDTRTDNVQEFVKEYAWASSDHSGILFFQKNDALLKIILFLMNLFKFCDHTIVKQIRN